MKQNPVLKRPGANMDGTLISVPTWVVHEDKPMYSIHFHPDGTRFASGGGDCNTKIWNVSPLESKEAEADESVHKLLCVISSAPNAVNCVQFSGCGKYLASGLDGGNVVLYHQSDQEEAVVAFDSDDKVYENWVVAGNLRKHSADVQDLCWSPDNHMLASCSVDNKVIVWNIARFEAVRVLQGHSGWVKGVAWDPVGTFLASHSADGSLIVWKTDDWTIVKQITDGFANKTAGVLGASDMNRQAVFSRLR